MQITNDKKGKINSKKVKKTNFQLLEWATKMCGIKAMAGSNLFYTHSTTLNIPRNGSKRST